MNFYLRILPALLAGAIALHAAQPWSKEPSRWTPEDMQKILTDSPWAQRAMATFGKKLAPEDMPVTPPPGAQAGGARGSMAGNRGVSDGRWDGGVARNTGVGEMPELPVTIRWDSAEPIREALERTCRCIVQPNVGYWITVLGLATKGLLDDDQKQAFVANTRLIPRGRAPMIPISVDVDQSGAAHFQFSRDQPIALSDKEVTFVTRFGSIGVEKKFRLKEMTYKGQLALGL
jgi:hypothetical protein